MIDRRNFIRQATAVPILAALSLVLPAVAVAKTTKNISYGPDSLDIYAPAAANAPVIVYVHGGAWRAGSKGEARGPAAYFNDLGYLVVSVGYSLSAPADQQADEVGAAVRWVEANIAQYGGDANRIAMMGHSAGTHLAALAALSGRAPGVRALVANDTGAYDLAYLAEIHNGRLPILYSALNNRAKWQAWSPISYAAGGGMPVLVAWSGADFRVKVSTRFADALAANGHEVVRFDGKGYNHLTIRSAVGRRGDRLNTAITNFLATYL
jgi:acetyl esterase/lipase